MYGSILVIFVVLTLAGLVALPRTLLGAVVFTVIIIAGAFALDKAKRYDQIKLRKMELQRQERMLTE